MLVLALVTLARVLVLLVGALLSQAPLPRTPKLGREAPPRPPQSLLLLPQFTTTCASTRSGALPLCRTACTWALVVLRTTAFATLQAVLAVSLGSELRHALQPLRPTLSALQLVGQHIPCLRISYLWR